MKRGLIKLIASCFFIGYIPIAPATCGSLIGVGLYLLTGSPGVAYFAVLALLLLLGFSVCGEAEKVWKGKDSRKIVIDDLTGAFLTFFLIPGRLLPSRGISAGFLGLVVSGFLIFRLVDIIKPWPLRRLERLNGSAGVMLDDLAAGLAANVVLHILRYMLRG